MNWVGQQIEWLKSFFSEDYTDRLAGKASSRRVMEIAVVWTFIFSYVRIGLTTLTFLPLDWTWAVMIAGILGLRTLDVLAQKKGLTNGNGNGNGTETRVPGPGAEVIVPGKPQPLSPPH